MVCVLLKAVIIQNVWDTKLFKLKRTIQNWCHWGSEMDNIKPMVRINEGGGGSNYVLTKKKRSFSARSQ